MAALLRVPGRHETEEQRGGGSDSRLMILLAGRQGLLYCEVEDVSVNFINWASFLVSLKLNVSVLSHFLRW